MLKFNFVVQIFFSGKSKLVYSKRTFVRFNVSQLKLLASIVWYGIQRAQGLYVFVMSLALSVWADVGATKTISEQ